MRDSSIWSTNRALLQGLGEGGGAKWVNGMKGSTLEITVALCTNQLGYKELQPTTTKRNRTIVGVAGEEEREIGGQGLCEQLIAENVPNLGKHNRHQNPGNTEDSHKIQRRPTINKAHQSQIHKILRQGKNPESSKGKTILSLRRKTDQGCSTPIHRNGHARKQWQDIVNVLNRKHMQPRILYPAKLSFKAEAEMKSFPDTQKFKGFVATSQTLQEVSGATLSGDERGRGAGGSIKDQKEQRPGRTRAHRQKLQLSKNTMAINSCLSVLTLNVSGLVAPVTR